MSCSKTEPYRWALSENLYDDDFREEIDPEEIRNLSRAQELERFGHACNLYDIDPDKNRHTVIIPRFKDLAFSAEDIERILGQGKLSFGNRDQIALLTGYEYLCLSDEFDA